MSSKSLILLRKTTAIGALVVALSACQPGEFLASLGGGDDAAETSETTSRTVKVTERDVEAPDVFQTADAGLWDGRPSLGGVWVAAPDVKDPERVIIRNPANGQFVIGALFKRERTGPGPRLQISSDAAAALGILAGAPTDIDVTALRREAVPIEEPLAVADADPADGTGVDTTEIAASSLDDPIASAAAAIESAQASSTARGAPTQRPEATASAAPAAPAAPATPAAPVSTLDRPFLQVGIFSVEQNATNTATALRGAGIIPTILEQETSGKEFWRVVVGPTNSASEREAILSTIKDLGFSDAYAVTN